MDSCCRLGHGRCDTPQTRVWHRLFPSTRTPDRLIATLINSQPADTPTDVVVPLATERGSIRVSASGAEQYRAAIIFVGEKSARGEYVLSAPDDTACTFFPARTAFCREQSFRV